jgi:hypothetical protein
MIDRRWDTAVSRPGKQPQPTHEAPELPLPIAGLWDSAQPPADSTPLPSNRATQEKLAAADMHAFTMTKGPPQWIIAAGLFAGQGKSVGDTGIEPVTSPA